MHSFYIDNPRLSQKFIESYIIEDDKIVIFLGNGTKYKMENTPNNLNKVKETMRKQVEESFSEIPVLKRKKIMFYVGALIELIGSVLVTLLGINLLFLDSINFMTILEAVCSFIGAGLLYETSLRFLMNGLHIADIQDDIKKNQIFVQIEDDIKESLMNNDFRITNDLTQESKEKIRSCTADSINLNDIHTLSLEELRQLRRNVDMLKWLKCFSDKKVSADKDVHTKKEASKSFLIKPKKNVKN